MSFDDFEEEPTAEEEVEQFLRERSRELHTQRGALLRSIHVASGIEHEIKGSVPGFIMVYLADMREQAIRATASLLAVKLSEEKRLQALMDIQPYAHLMKWLKDKTATGRDATDQVEDIDQLLEGIHDN